MKETGKNPWLLKKAYEIAYAVFRVSAKMEEKDFAGYFKRAATILLGAAANGDLGESSRGATTLEYLTRFAMDVSILGIVNGDILLKEIAGFASALSETGSDGFDIKTGNDEEVDLADIFSAEPTMILEEEKKEVRQNQEFGNRVESGNISPRHESGNEINGILKSAIRQSAIIDRIRQTGNCRIKDIQEVLPNASERTIRYDLQTLVEQGLIEKMGSAGPSVYYRVLPEAGEAGGSKTANGGGIQWPGNNP